MDMPLESLAYGNISVRLAIRRDAWLVETDRPAIRMRRPAVDLCIGVVHPKYSCEGSPHGVSSQGCIPVQFFEVRRVARRCACRCPRAVDLRNRWGQSARREAGANHIAPI